MNTTAIRSLAMSAMLATAAVATAGQGQTDYSKVQIKTTKLASNFYTL